jgi:hypothetical protein
MVMTVMLTRRKNGKIVEELKILKELRVVNQKLVYSMNL